MDAYRFRCSKLQTLVAYTTENEVAKIPSGYCSGEWVAEGPVTIAPGLIGVNVKRALEDLEVNGFHIAQGRVRVEVEAST